MMKCPLVAIISNAVGIILFIMAYMISDSREDWSTIFDDNHLYIEYAGEGFRGNNNTHITTRFDDYGNVEIRLAPEDTKKKDSDIVWMKMLDSSGYVWESSGRVENVIIDDSEDNGFRVTNLFRNNDVSFLEYFRITVNDGATIKIRLDKPLYESDLYFGIHTPLLCALSIDGDSFAEKYAAAFRLVDEERDGLLENASDDVIVEGLGEHLLQVGKIGDVSLSPMASNVTMIYSKTDLEFDEFELHARPEGNKKETGRIVWNGFQQVYPIVEYRKTNTIRFYDRMIEILYGICSIMIPAGVIGSLKWINSFFNNIALIKILSNYCRYTKSNHSNGF